MATVYWLGTADPVAQVWTASIDSVDGTPANNTFTVTIGDVAISQVGTTDVATTAAALVALLNASTHPYFAAVTWDVPSAGNIRATADTAGVPFVAALTETGAGTGSVTDFAETTASAAPNAWSTAANWSGGAVPADGDDVFLRNSSVDIAWGLAQSAVTLSSLHIEHTYTGRIGLHRGVFAQSADGNTTTTSAKGEYRQTYLEIGIDELVVGANSGIGTPTGSDRIKVDNAKAGASTCTVLQTNINAAEDGLPVFRYLAAHASAELYVRSAPGGVGVAADAPDETATLGVIACDAEQPSTLMQIGAGTTVTTFRQREGVCELRAAATISTATLTGGLLTTEGDYTITTLNVDGGTCYANHIKTSASAITTANVNGGLLSGARSTDARTWDTVNLEVGGSIAGSGGAVTITTLNEPAGEFTLTAA